MGPFKSSKFGFGINVVPIDISPKGKDKSQIVQDFHPDDVLHFYGDRMDVMGNDYPLKKIIIDADLGHAISVTDWQDTWEKLKCV